MTVNISFISKSFFFAFALCLILTSAATVSATEFNSTISMKDKGASTFYVPCMIEGYGDVEMMFDTGSSYMTINEKMLRVLLKKGHAHYVKELDAKMADGSHAIIPVYRLKSVHVGDHCEIHDVEAAVLPGASRNLLGLSVLKKTSPFIFYNNPPRLVLSHCPTKITKADQL